MKVSSRGFPGVERLLGLLGRAAACTGGARVTEAGESEACEPSRWRCREPGRRWGWAAGGSDQHLCLTRVAGPCFTQQPVIVPQCRQGKGIGGEKGPCSRAWWGGGQSCPPLGIQDTPSPNAVFSFPSGGSVITRVSNHLLRFECWTGNLSHVVKPTQK